MCLLVGTDRLLLFDTLSYAFMSTLKYSYLSRVEYLRMFCTLGTSVVTAALSVQEIPGRVATHARTLGTLRFE